MRMMLAYITCRDETEARKISMYLIKKRLIACANIFPIKSLYLDKGKVIKNSENVIIAKTTDKRYKELEEEVRRVHSYKVPCILRINAGANKEYESWAVSEIK